MDECVAVAVAEAVAVAVTEAVAEADQSIHDQSIHDHPQMGYQFCPKIMKIDPNRTSWLRLGGLLVQNPSHKGQERHGTTPDPQNGHKKLKNPVLGPLGPHGPPWGPSFPGALHGFSLQTKQNRHGQIPPECQEFHSRCNGKASGQDTTVSYSRTTVSYTHLTLPTKRIV